MTAHERHASKKRLPPRRKKPRTRRSDAASQPVQSAQPFLEIEIHATAPVSGRRFCTRPCSGRLTRNFPSRISTQPPTNTSRSANGTFEPGFANQGAATIQTGIRRPEHDVQQRNVPRFKSHEIECLAADAVVNTSALRAFATSTTMWLTPPRTSILSPVRTLARTSGKRHSFGPPR
jgi:hypothetical protein